LGAVVVQADLHPTNKAVVALQKDVSESMGRCSPSRLPVIPEITSAITTSS
jgi:hypothetical protein